MLFYSTNQTKTVKAEAGKLAQMKMWQIQQLTAGFELFKWKMPVKASSSSDVL